MPCDRMPRISRVLEVPEIKTHIPYFAAYGAAVVMELAWRLLKKKTRPLLTTYAVKNLGSRLRFSIERAEKELGWKPDVDFETGFANTMEWLKTLDLDAIAKK